MFDRRQTFESEYAELLELMQHYDAMRFKWHQDDPEGSQDEFDEHYRAMEAAGCFN